MHFLRNPGKGVSLLDNEKVTKSDTENVFKNPCADAFRMKRVNVQPTRKDNKPWFNHDCENARNIYYKTRRQYNLYRTDYYKKKYGKQ